MEEDDGIGPKKSSHVNVKIGYETYTPAWSYGLQMLAGGLSGTYFGSQIPFLPIFSGTPNIFDLVNTDVTEYCVIHWDLVPSK